MQKSLQMRISGYLPRSARNLFTSEYAAQNSNDAVNAQNIVNKMTGDQMRRADSMKLPEDVTISL